MSRLLSTAITAAIICSAASASDVLVYDVDFTDHPVAAPPLTGNAPAPRTTVSTVTTGNPLVMSSFMTMTDKPCVFDGADRFFLSFLDLPFAESHTLDFDLIVDGDNDTTFFVDFFAPNGRSLEFRPNGILALRLPGFGTLGLGEWNADTTMHFTITIDHQTGQMIIQLDGDERYAGNFFWDTLQNVAFGTTVDGNVVAAVDNIRIFADERCAGDVDNSGSVHINDLLEVLAQWGTCDDACSADIDNDGYVDVNDLLDVLSDWGPCVL